MNRSRKYRSLAALALLGLNENDLRALHATVSEMSPGSFLELIRDIEDEINNSIALTLDQAAERALFDASSAQFYHKIDQIRRKDLRISVQNFVDMMTDGLSPAFKDRDIEIPRFDSRRGLEAWIRKLAQVISEQEIYHIAMRIRNKSIHSGSLDWRLR